MAIIKDNVWVEGASGAARKGSIVYRQRMGRTLVSGRPSSSSVPATDRQIAHRERFNRATVYAKLALQNDQLRERYEDAAAGTRLSAYNMAVRDSLKAPKIETISLDEYDGTTGSRIFVLAYDDFELKSLKVRLHNGAGNTLQEGDATLADDRALYAYTLTADVTSTPVYATAIAEDHAGNVTEYEVEVVSGMPG
ncbi:hypothetical protein AB9P05_09725 [Roseivirga sp. BDSF3-8]|uniref:hypothetical protein n=1 Tax=Roseivirga sp. BDSF3-8 TaxID=3241598 RepID=UPI0035322BD9